MKFIKFFIDAIYWLGIFIIPAGIIGFVSLWLFTDGAINRILSGIIYASGIICGIVLAEFVRKNYGLNNFWSRLSSNSDTIKKE